MRAARRGRRLRAAFVGAIERSEYGPTTERRITKPTTAILTIPG